MKQTEREIKIGKVDLAGPNQATQEDIREFFRRLNGIDGDFKYNSSWCSISIYETSDGWKTQCVEDFGGGEGSGEERWSVIKVTDPAGNETYWEIPGFYQSYEGSSWEIESTFQVVSGEKVIRVWSPV